MNPVRTAADGFLDGLQATTRDALLAQAERVHLRRGEVVFRQGEPARWLWIVLKGWVHLLRAPDGGGRGVVIFTITPEEALCGVAGIATETLTVTATAATDCDLLRVPLPLFLEHMERDPHLGAATVRLCARRLASIARQYGAMAEPVPHRLIRTLLRLHDQFGTDIPMTHRELGQMAWTTTESAIRALRALKRRGLLGGSRGRVTLRDPAALARELTDRGAEVIYDRDHRLAAHPSRTLEASNEIARSATCRRRR